MEENVETTIIYYITIGQIHGDVIYRGYIGIMEEKMESIISGRRVYNHFATLRQAAVARGSPASRGKAASNRDTANICKRAMFGFCVRSHCSMPLAHAILMNDGNASRAGSMHHLQLGGRG